MTARSIFRRVTLGGDALRSATLPEARQPDRSPVGRETERDATASQTDLAMRFDALLGVLRGSPARPSLLDLGCGPGLLLDHLRAAGRERQLAYTGVDTAPPMIEAAVELWPEARFFRRDVLDAPFSEQSFDYVLVNGLSVEGLGLSETDGAARTQRLIESAFRFCRIGMAFHLPTAPSGEHNGASSAWSHAASLASLTERLTRHVVLRGDCGLPYHTVYLYRAPDR